MRVIVLSDTHAPRRWRTCPPAVAALLRGADLILHAGDVCTASVLDELAQYAPVTAVVGNNDDATVASWGASATASLVIDGLRVAMIHDSGPSGGRAGRLRRQFPGSDLVVFGHSHIPLDVEENGFRIFNPGSPTDRRRQPQGTVGLLTVSAGQLISAAIVPVTLTLPSRPALPGPSRVPRPPGFRALPGPSRAPRPPAPGTLPRLPRAWHPPGAFPEPDTLPASPKPHSPHLRARPRRMVVATSRLSPAGCHNQQAKTGRAAMPTWVNGSGGGHPWGCPPPRNRYVEPTYSVHQSSSSPLPLACWPVDALTETAWVG